MKPFKVHIYLVSAVESEGLHFCNSCAYTFVLFNMQLRGTQCLFLMSSPCGPLVKKEPQLLVCL